MSIPNWWGDWRPTLTPHTGNLLATDLIECTMIVGGLPVNTVITGAQILGAVPTPSVAWGSITGTLSAQTDLNTALSGKASTGAVTGTGITMSTARILGRSTAGTGAIEEITIGSGLTLSAGTLSASGGGLTVGTTAIASGTVGRILFEGTGNVLQQSANLFWDNTNSRLGIGTASPSALLHTVGSVTASGGTARGNYMQPTLVASANNNNLVGLDILPTYTPGVFTGTNNIALRANGRVIIGTSTDSGSSYPPTLYVQSNNALFAAAPAHGGLWVQQNNTGNFAAASFFGNSLINQFMIGRTGSAYSGMATKSFLHSSGNDIWITASTSGSPDPANHVMLMFQATRNVAINSTTDAGYKLDVNGTTRIQSKLSVGTPSAASAVMEVTSTTQGFLPPRMTNAQMLAIAAPAAGLIVYDTTNNKHVGYDGTAWQNFY